MNVRTKAPIREAYRGIDSYSSIFEDIGSNIKEGIGEIGKKIIVGAGGILDSERIATYIRDGLFGYESTLDLSGGTSKPTSRDDLPGGTANTDKFVREWQKGLLQELEADVYGPSELVDIVKRVDRGTDKTLLERGTHTTKHPTTYIVGGIGTIKYGEVEIGNEKAELPVGDREAFYIPGVDIRVIDKSIFPGTKENELKIKIYETAKNIVTKYPVKGAKRLKNFYEGRIKALKNWATTIKGITHEDVHPKLEYADSNAKLNLEQKEGLTEAIAEQILGVKSKELTVYNVCKERAEETAYKIGIEPIDILKYPELVPKFSYTHKSLFPEPVLQPAYARN